MSESTKGLRNSTLLKNFKIKFKHKGVSKFSAYFHNSNSTVFDAIIENMRLIVDNKKVNLKELLSEELFKKIQIKNKGTVSEDGAIDSFIENDIVTNLREILKENSQNGGYEWDERVSNDSYQNLSNCEILDDDYILPTKKLDRVSLFYNLFNDNNIKFAFNEKLPYINSNENQIVNKEFVLFTECISTINIPTKHNIICKHKITGKNIKPTFCNNITEFSPVDIIHNSMKCDAGHTLKDLNKALPQETRKMYIYRGKEITNTEEDFLLDKDDTCNILSFVNIDCEEFVGNVIPIFDSASSKTNYLLLSYKGLDNKKVLDKKIINKKSGEWFFLFDLFDSVKNYFIQVHNEPVTNQNKYFAVVMMLQQLCNTYFKTKYPALLLGATQSGKTYWYDLLSSLFLNNTVKVEGGVTRNKFIGGQSGLSINNLNRLFLPGYVETKSFIFIEEMAEKLDDYVDTSKHFSEQDKNNNLFMMHKQCYDSGGHKEVDIGIQGSHPVKVNAVPFSTGNSTSLVFNNNNYKKRIREVYNKLGGNMELWSVHTPLFKDLSYYKDFLKNDLLMKAHKKVRDEYGSFFMTGLQRAEQSRFLFFGIIDDNDKKYKIDNKVKRKRSKLGTIYRKTHKKEFWAEMEKIFGKVRLDTPEKEEFLDDVNDFVERYYERNPHQFGFDCGEVPGHLLKNLARMCGDLLLLNKTFYNLPLEFTVEDKKMLIWWNSFNYRMLSIREASMIDNPKISDEEIDVDNIYKEIDVVKEQRKLDDEERGVLILSDEEKDIFDELESNTVENTGEFR